MRRKGIEFKRTPNLDWRYPDPETDATARGEAIKSNYMVIFSRKSGKTIPLSGFSRTNMAYGMWRKSPRNSEVETCPVYWVEDNRVYRGTVRRIKITNLSSQG